MSKNIVKIILERKMNIEENIINNIMDYHGDIDKMLPEGNFPENIKRCMRMDNWELTKNNTLNVMIYMVCIILKNIILK